MILGVAVVTAGGAVFVARNMSVSPPTEVVVESGTQQPEITLTDVLVLAGDVPTGGAVENNIGWQPWQNGGGNPSSITRNAAHEVFEEFKEPVGRFAMYSNEQLHKS